MLGEILGIAALLAAVLAVILLRGKGKGLLAPRATLALLVEGAIDDYRDQPEELLPWILHVADRMASSPGDRVEAATKLLELGRPGEAGTLAESALIGDLTRSDVLADAAHVISRAGEPARARMAIERARAIRPLNERETLTYARILLESKACDHAIEILTERCDACPSSYMLRWWLGRALLLADRPAEALETLLAAGRLAPAHVLRPGGYLDRGADYLCTDIEEAIRRVGTPGERLDEGKEEGEPGPDETRPRMDITLVVLLIGTTVLLVLVVLYFCLSR